MSVRSAAFLIVLLGMVANGSAEGAVEGDRWQESIARLFSGSVHELMERNLELEASLTSLPTSPGRQDGPNLGMHSPLFSSPSVEYAVELDLGSVKWIDAIALVPAAVESGAFTGAGYGFPVRYRVAVSKSKDFRDAETILDQTLEDSPNPGRYPVMIPTPQCEACYVRLSVVKHFQRRPSEWLFALAEMIVLSSGRNVALGCKVTATRQLASPPQWSLSYVTDGKSPLGLPVSTEASPTNGYLAVHGDQADLTKWVQVDLGSDVVLDEIRLIPARPTDYADDPAHGFPLRFKVEVADDQTFSARRTVFETGDEDFPNPGDNIVTLPAVGARGKFIRVTGTRLRGLDHRSSFSFAELQAYSGGVNVARGKSVTALDVFDDPKYPKWKPEYLVDDFTSQHRLMELPEWLSGLDQRRRIEVALAGVQRKLTATSDAVMTNVFRVGFGVLGFAMGCLLWFVVRQRRARHRDFTEIRARFASDLHDEIGSQLGSIALAARLGIRKAEDPDATRERLEEIERIARDTTASMHDIVWLLKPGSARLDQLLSRMREAANTQLRGHEVHFDCEAVEDCALGIDFTRQVFLLYREALNNVSKHAEASRVEIRVAVSKGRLSLAVRDRGIGFDPSTVAPGNGLENMHLRAKQIGGTLQLTSQSGQGTTVELEVPLR